MRGVFVAVAAAALFLPVALPAGAQAAAEKKLIQYGFDVQGPAYVAEHIREMEKKPFDGIMMPTGPNGFSHAFYNCDTTAR